jgi:hypothetical protein
MNEPTPEAAKAIADAKLAQLNLEQREREVAEWQSDLATRRRAAEHESAIAKAGKDVADAQPSPWTTLASGLADVPRGATTVSGDQPIMGSALALTGLRTAAGKVADVVRKKAPNARTILVTSEADLATVDAAHCEVAACLRELTTAVDRYLPSGTQGQPSARSFMGAETAAAVVGALIPSVVGMLAAQRTVTTFATTADDLAATASVVGALLETVPEVQVVHDDFRMRTESGVDKDLAALRDKRWELAKVVVPEGAVALKEQIAALVKAVDAFDTAVRAVPAGARRSALTNAALYEELHKDTDGIDHVLLVKGLPGSGTQVVDDRPLWFKDRFSVTSTVNITYLLLAAGKSNRIVHGGTASATVTMRGKIGDRVEPEAR